MAIIDMHSLGLWDKFIKKNQILLTTTVINEATHYPRAGEVFPISLQPYIDDGKIREIMISAGQIKDVLDKVGVQVFEGLHDGEKECLAYVYGEKGVEFKFCTSDKVAVIAVVLLGHSDHLISLENLLRSCGLTPPIGFSDHHSEKRLRQYIKEGKAQRLREVDL